MRALPHIFARTFNVPLAVQPSRVEALIAGLRTASFARGRANGDDDDDDEVEYPEPPETEFNSDDEKWERERAGYSISSGGVAWLPVRDVLVRRAGHIDADSTELESYAHIGLVLRLCIADARVNGVLLDIDSCGGESGGLFDLCADIRAAATVKPIWAIANDDCLSAAYGIASATGRIWITRTGSAGSIGVVALHTDQSGFDADAGVRFEYVYAGEHKTDFNPHEPLGADARALLQAEIDRLYGMFVGQVAAYRGLSPAAVAATEAKVFYGEDAVSAGLADDIGTFGEAVAAMSEMLGDPTMDPEDITGLAALPQATADQPVITAIAPEAVEAAQAGAVNIVRLDAVRQATGNVRRDAAEIVNLCAVAGMPQLAAEYITKDTPVAAVRADLLRRKSEASAAHQVETIDTSQQVAQAAARQSEMSTVIKSRFAAQMGRKG
jgi:signal peptide peptidase SppA